MIIDEFIREILLILNYENKNFSDLYAITDIYEQAKIIFEIRKLKKLPYFIGHVESSKHVQEWANIVYSFYIDTLKRRYNTIFINTVFNTVYLLELS